MLNKGADINDKDDYDYTSLIYASKYKFMGIVKELLRGENIDLKTALNIALTKRHFKVYKIIRNKMIEIEASEERFKFACKTGRWKCMSL